MNRLAMGNESSQLERSGAGPERAARTIGPSMSPTPEPEDGESRQAPGPATSSLAWDAEPPLDDLPSKKKKKKKRRKSLDNDAVAPEAAARGQQEVQPSDSTSKSKRKRSKRKELELQPEEEVDNAVIEATPSEPQTAETEEPPSSPKRKKKRSKKNGKHVDDLPIPNGLHTEDLRHERRVDEDHEALLKHGKQLADAPPVDHLPEHPPEEVLQSPVLGKKQAKRRRKKRVDGLSSEPQEVYIANADDGSPPSAQPPRFNNDPLQELNEDEEEDVAVIPSSQWEPSQRQSTRSLDPSQLKREFSNGISDIPLLDPGQLKREPSESEDEVDEHLQSHFVGIAAANLAEAINDPVAEAIRERDPENGLGWLHKRENAPQETPITDTRIAPQRSMDASLPDLQPSQVKTEPGVDSDSVSDSDKSTQLESRSEPDSDSPTAQRSERLSGPRSRSVSRAPAGSGTLADQALRIVENPRPAPYSQVPYSAPSSTGSNRSIPARLPSPSSTGSDHSIPARVEPSLSRLRSSKSLRPAPADAESTFEDGDAVDVDSPAVRDARPPRSRVKKATPGRRKVTAKPKPDEVDATTNSEPVVETDAGAADNEALTNGDAIDIDQPSVPDKATHETRRATRATLSRKTEATQPTQPVEAETANCNIDAVEINTGTQAAKPKNPRKSPGSNDVADSNVHVMTNWLGSSVNGARLSEAEATAQNVIADDELPLDDIPAAEEPQPAEPEPVVQAQKSQRRQPKVSLVDKGVTTRAAKEPVEIPEPVTDKGMSAPSRRGKGKGPAVRDNAPTDGADTEANAREHQIAAPEAAAVENAEAAREASIEPGESASQPQPTPKSKGKKRRMLNQPKVSLSLSQMEVEDEDFSTMFSRRNSTKTLAVGVSNGLDEDQPGTSHVPSPVRPRKIKRRKRGAKDASEDEMESILAAGPSKGRKRRGTPGLSGNEDGRASKKKRLSTAGNGKASGVWSQDELDALGRVVDLFREENGMTQEELNNLIHEVPNKADPTNKDFWDKADMAVPRRTRKQVAERARRIYHNFAARGTWTEEQKEEVHDLFERHPSKWGQIANMINRHQQDVRDYWRNHYLVHQSQVKARWGKDEEDRLKEVVEEAINKIRIDRENNDQLRPRPRVKKTDDEAMVDWQQISAAMDLTRSRQQCKWKWIDMREKGLVGDGSIRLPTQPRSSAGGRVNGISEELANAREDYRGMGPEEKFRLIDAIKDSGARDDKNIPWRSLVDAHFRLKWHRPALKLVWYRMRQTCPNFDTQDVEANARHLVNYYHMHQMLPRFDEASADDALEEQVVHYARGKKVWKRLSTDVRAIRERQRRSSSASSRASSRFSRRVSSEILNLSGDEGSGGEESAAPRSRSRQSTELGEGQEDRGRRARSRPSRAAAGTSLASDELEVTIPGHLKGAAAKKALEQARAKAKGKGKARVIDLDGPAESARRVRSNSVAIDSESEG